MSLLNKNNAFNVRDYLFVAVGLLCVSWFFYSYPFEDPRSIINTSMDEGSAEVKGMQVFENLGYTSENVHTTVTLESNEDLLDSLQSHLGRQQAISQLSDDSLYPGIYPYYWQIQITSQNKNPQDSQSESTQPDNNTLRLDEQGRLIEFSNPQNILPARPLNREALIAAFDTDPDLQLWKTVPDSAWDRKLKFNANEDYQDSSSDEAIDSEYSEEEAHSFSKSNIQKLATFYLQKGGWELKNLDLSEIQIKTVHSRTVAEVNFATAEAILGQDISVDLTLLPTGTLLSLDATYNQSSTNNSLDVLGITRAALVFLFALATLILFYFRIRARAVDTQPSLVVGVIVGLMIPAAIFLQRWAETPSFSSIETGELVGIALQMGTMGALSCMGFFVLFAVGDSLMRQHWPEKLSIYDFLRQGMFFNKPIGEMILRSTVLAVIICGIWSLTLSFFPDLYFQVGRTFFDFEAAGAPIYLYLNSAWFSLIITLGIFAVVGTLIFGSYGNKWLAGMVMILGLILVSPVMQAMGPGTQELIFFSITAVLFTLIFLKWDILTTFYTHFLFILMLESSSGWIIAGSPDFAVFVVFCLFLLFNVVAAILFISKGEKEQSLPSYVPQYVEEMAQEERIKQELQIAREVQQSFLPVETPSFEHLDLAAICKPAYETGGDYYDIIRLDDNRVAVTIGDVSGKGIQAAFYMTFIKGILHSLCREIESPAEILKKTNRLFYDNAPRGTFISLVYGIVDLEKETFLFARAGHNPVLQLSSQNGNVKELRPKGIGIGLTEGASFDNNIEELELSLCTDDLLVLYTDGIVEALNATHQFYGSDRLNSLLNNHKDLSAADLLKALSGDLKTYIGNAKQHDDMTMVIMKLKKNVVKPS